MTELPELAGVFRVLVYIDKNLCHLMSIVSCINMGTGTKVYLTTLYKQ